jgi:hypothetical protein
MNLDKLDKEELVELITAYDNYIQEANVEDVYSEGFRPLGLTEYYEEEFKNVL